MHRRLLALAVGLATAASISVPATALAATRPSGKQLQAVLSLSSGGHARAAVVSYARRHGLRVVDDGPGFVVVQGVAGSAAGAFGTVPGGRPRVPRALAGSVRSVAGLDTRPLFHPALSGYAGSDIRSAYGLAKGAGGAGITVATVQFSGWNQGDAATYASAAGIPLAAGQITSIGVAGANPATVDGSGGDVEVALDVESILAVAPQAKQRVYVTSNSTSGAVAAYQQIAADVQAGLVQVVSESWGSCERDTGAFNMNAMAAALNSVVAAGATVFASTGDTGPYACYTPSWTADTSTPNVNFPASMPTVVAVGGTSLTRPGGVWAESAWASSGGGQSGFYARPSYQSALGLPGSGRLLPDVAADADASTGMAVYASSQGWVLAGGTSLASPVWAASLAVALSSAGRTSGVGDIHQTLYANPSAFRDVTSGGNALFSAGAGFDELTGLGTPQWGQLAPLLLPAAAAAPPPSDSNAAPAPSQPTGTAQDPTSPAPPTSSPTPAPTAPVAPQPRTTARACPSSLVPQDAFGDVPSADPHAADIACAAWWGLAKGTTTTTYSPLKTVTRGQMAAFVARLIRLTGGQLAAGPLGTFTDVTSATQFADDIDALSAAGIVQGAGDGTFRPQAPVTRGQMATFLARAYAFRVGTPLPAATTTLSDVAADAHGADIAAIVAAGLAGGYADGTYRPTVAVPREQMATFVARLVDLLVTDGFGTVPKA